MDIKENKTPQPPKRPTMIFYGIVLLILVAMNFIVLPSLAERSVKEVSYDEFISDLEKGKIKEVKLGEGIIYFSEEKEGKNDKVQLYKTGYVKDEKLIERLDESGVTYGSEMPEKVNPFLNFIFTWILPLVVIWTIGGWFMRRMMKNIGGSGGPGLCPLARAMPRFT